MMSDMWVTELSDGSWGAAPADEIEGFVSGAGYSTVPQYRPDRTGRCKANGDTCRARRAKGTELCIGHLRAAGVGSPVHMPREEVSVEHAAGDS